MVRNDRNVGYFDDKDKPRSSNMLLSAGGQFKDNVLNMRVSKLIVLVLTVVIVFVVYRVLRSSDEAPPQVPYGVNKYGPTKMDDIEIAKYMTELRDTRPLKCQEQKHDKSLYGRVSILVHFNEDQFYDAKLTIHSVIAHTPANLYKEIVMFDDGSQSRKLLQHVAQYIAQHKNHKLIAYRSEDSHGESSSKLKASRVASGDILVFLSSRTVVNEGWLEPLLDAVTRDHTMIATPHVDNFLSDYRFFENKHNHVNMLSLTLGTYYYERENAADKEEDIGYVTNPVLRGDAFVMHRTFLNDLGDFDEDIKGGGEHLELSLRAWMCGGQIKIIPCSRVATHDALTPVQVTNPDSVRRITELWLGDFKHIVYNQAKVMRRMSDDEKAYLRSRRGFVKADSCKTFTWYHDTVATALVLPNTMPRHFGSMGDKTGYCVRVPSKASYDLTLAQCRPHTYDPLKMVEMTSTGLLIIHDKCLQVTEEGKVILSNCDENADTLWDMYSYGRVFLRSDTNVCLTHVMERNRQNELIHDLAMDTCQNHREQLWTFTNY